MRNIVLAIGIAASLIAFGPFATAADNVAAAQNSHSAMLIPASTATAVTPVHRWGWDRGPRWGGYYYPYSTYYYPTYVYPYANSYAYPVYPYPSYSYYPYSYPYYGGGVYWSGPRRSFGIEF
jgi:hypothetical protein